MQFAQIFSFLMALSGFGVDSNPKAPTADAVLEHSVDDADLIVHLDIAAIAPRNFKALTDLPKDPGIKSNPELLAKTKEIAAQATQGRAMVKGMLGLDVVTDLQSVTAFVKLHADGSDPDAVIEIRGTIPPDLVTKVSKMSGAPLETFGGRTGVVLPDHKYLGVTKSGSVLVGTDTLVKPRLADGWKAPARAAGSRGARVAAILDEKPFLAWAVSPSQTLVKMLEGKTGKNAATEMVKDLDLAVGGLRADGLVWAVYHKSKAGFDRSSLAADGMIDLMRAFQIAPRGFAKVAVAYLDAYAGQSKEIDDLIKHKDEILKIVDTFTGDGQFKATVDRDPKGKSVTVHAIGKHLSEVLPAGMIVPLAAAGAWVGMARATATAPAAVQVAPPPPVNTTGRGKPQHPVHP